MIRHFFTHGAVVDATARMLTRISMQERYVATEKPTIHESLCLHCNNPFISKRKEQRYCSSKCNALDNVALRARNLPARKDIQERFWENVDTTGECWLWKGKLYPNGYGYFFSQKTGKRRGKLAHRTAWEWQDPALSQDTKILHTCDIRSCVRNDEQGWYESEWGFASKVGASLCWNDSRQYC